MVECECGHSDLAHSDSGCQRDTCDCSKTEQEVLDSVDSSSTTGDSSE